MLTAQEEREDNMSGKIQIYQMPQLPGNLFLLYL